jgi:hypothetical protein
LNQKPPGTFFISDLAIENSLLFDALAGSIRRMKAILSILSLIFVVGCATTSTQSGGGKKEIQVFQIENPPTQKYTVIKTVKDDAGEDEEDEITDEFIKQARKVGADAVVFKKKAQSGMEVVPFGFGKMKYTYLYTVELVRFEPQ